MTKAGHAARRQRQSDARSGFLTAKHGLLAAGLMLLPLAAVAYKTDGTRWARGEAVFHVDIPGTSPSGISWNEAFEDAMAEWSEKTAFRFYLTPEYRDPCAGYRRSLDGNDFPAGNGDTFNGVDFRDSMCGNDLGRGVAAVTLILSRSGPQGFPHIVQTDILFNSDFDWDVFTGLRRGVDFRRTALHELGHALGLNHEDEELAIMGSRLTSIDRLQADDIRGAEALYGGPGECVIRELSLGSTVNGSLESGDCAMFQLYKGGSDTSFVDAWRLNIERETQVSILMESSALDPVLILARADLSDPEEEPWLDDDSGGGCSARLTRTLPAGEYLVLANTYVNPQKCGGNSGPYRLTVTDKSLVTSALALAGDPSGAHFTGGASRDGGLSYATLFGAAEPVSVSADILVADAHVGSTGSLFVMAVLEDGRRFAKNAAGQFERVRGGVADLPAFRNHVRLAGKETVNVLDDFRGIDAGLAGEVAIYVGYALGDSREIIHNREPIRFTIE